EGRPIDGAVVSVQRAGEEDDHAAPPMPWPRLSTRSDRSGEFEIFGKLPPGRFTVIANGFNEGITSPVEVGKRVEVGDLVADASGSLRVGVARMPGFEFQVRLRRRESGQARRWSDPVQDTYSPPPLDDVDVFEVERLRAGRYDVLVGLGRERG